MQINLFFNFILYYFINDNFINIIKFIGEKNNTYISHTFLGILKNYCIKNNNINDCCYTNFMFK